MNDKELLEKAAKAVGYSTAHYFDGEFMGADRYEFFDGPNGWNPLTDDGDALRLVVKLRLQVEWWKTGIEVSHPDLPPSAIHNTEYEPYAATRRAIVRAAAQIGETK